MAGLCTSRCRIGSAVDVSTSYPMISHCWVSWDMVRLQETTTHFDEETMRRVLFITASEDQYGTPELSEPNLMCSLKHSLWLTSSHVSSHGLGFDSTSCMVISITTVWLVCTPCSSWGMYSMRWGQALSFGQSHLWESKRQLALLSNMNSI